MSALPFLPLTAGFAGQSIRFTGSAYAIDQAERMVGDIFDREEAGGDTGASALLAITGGDGGGGDAGGFPFRGGSVADDAALAVERYHAMKVRWV